MSLILFGAIVAIVGVISGVYLGGYMAEREGRKAKAQQDAPPAQPADAASAPPAEKRRFWFVPTSQSDQAVQFQSWASANLQNADLRTWVAGLSKEQVRALSEQLTTFCTSLGFNLDWLTSGRLASNPNLEPMAVVIVEHYCTACFQATAVQGDFQLFKKALEVLDQPFNREHKPITQKLYAELVRRDAAPALPPDLMVASEQARQEQIARTLREVAASNWATFMAAFEEATKADGAAKPKASWSNTLRRPFRQREAAPQAAGASTTTNLSSQAPVPNEQSN